MSYSTVSTAMVPHLPRHDLDALSATSTMLARAYRSPTVWASQCAPARIDFDNRTIDSFVTFDTLSEKTGIPHVTVRAQTYNDLHLHKQVVWRTRLGAPQDSQLPKLANLPLDDGFCCYLDIDFIPNHLRWRGSFYDNLQRHNASYELVYRALLTRGYKQVHNVPCKNIAQNARAESFGIGLLTTLYALSHVVLPFGSAAAQNDATPGTPLRTALVILALFCYSPRLHILLQALLAQSVITTLSSIIYTDALRDATSHQHARYAMRLPQGLPAMVAPISPFDMMNKRRYGASGDRILVGR